MTAEQTRLEEARTKKAPWKKWGPYLSERQWGIFSLTGAEGNHGEDVKEYHFYVDSTPTHSYMTHVHKYAQAASLSRRP